MKKFNVGIIGYSWAADAHIKAINSTSLARVTAIYSKRKLDPTEISKLYGTKIDIYNDLDLMLSNSEINIVSICSYPDEHARQAIAVARAGKNMIIEKPLALSWEDCLAVESAVNLAGVKVCVCFECRFSSQFITTKAILDKGLLDPYITRKWIIIMALVPGMASFAGIPEKMQGEAVFYQQDVMRWMPCCCLWEMKSNRLAVMLQPLQTMIFNLMNIPPAVLPYLNLKMDQSERLLPSLIVFSPTIFMFILWEVKEVFWIINFIQINWRVWIKINGASCP